MINYYVFIKQAGFCFTYFCCPLASTLLMLYKKNRMHLKLNYTRKKIFELMFYYCYCNNGLSVVLEACPRHYEKYTVIALTNQRSYTRSGDCKNL